MKTKIRTLTEIQLRIIFLQERLHKILKLSHLSNDEKKVISKFEQQTIDNLKGQLRFRIDWYLNCINLKI